MKSVSKMGFRTAVLAGLWTGILSLPACQIQDVPVLPQPVSTPEQTLSYPLDVPLQPGFSGTFQLEYIGNEEAQSFLSVSGRVPGRRYFGRISRSNAADVSPAVDFADLGELDSEGTVRIRIPKDYQNRPLLFDSLAHANAMVRILEVEPGKLGFREVLRGDIGSNVLTGESREFPVSPVQQTGAGGTARLVQRKNRNTLLQLSLSGIPADGAPLELNAYSGNFESGDYRKTSRIGSLIRGTSSTQIVILPVTPPSLQYFDTLVGFLALEAENQVLAIVNFGGNRISGEALEYPLYAPGDSAQKGKVRFEIVGSGRIRMQFQPLSIPEGEAPLYLSLHRNTAFDGPDSLQTWQVSRTGVSVFQNLRSETGLISLESIREADVCFRLSEDKVSGNNPLATADIGQNEVEAAPSERAVLNLPIAPEFGGSLLFRKRRNGEVLFFYRLTNSQSFIENRLVIRKGPRPESVLPQDTTETVFRLAVFPGATGGPVRGASNLVQPNGQPALWPAFILQKGTGAYPEHFFDDGGDLYLLSRGEFL